MLKTLKDIRKGNLWIGKINIKQEAIKDIKFIREKGESYCGHYEEVVDYIMWKNNITEEDLK